MQFILDNIWFRVKIRYIGLNKYILIYNLFIVRLGFLFTTL